eukprot:TRINITY_DN13837_c0_g2_i1.p1 TRINITY_DN13837_c0_g2~~TRINITY_DN13837_c0_g2_i1.p1  ORF type:complete len:530 (+),score=74.15 TRINITY_DN13837_c0_g2_i1:59-1648(+)
MLARRIVAIWSFCRLFASASQHVDESTCSESGQGNCHGPDLDDAEAEAIEVKGIALLQKSYGHRSPKELSLDDSGIPSYDSVHDQDVRTSASLVFDKLIGGPSEKKGSAFTQGEQQAFKERFVEKVAAVLNKKSFSTLSDADEKEALWKKHVAKAFENQHPVLTLAEVNFINSGNFGWKASYNKYLEHFPREHFPSRLGKLVPPDHNKSLLEVGVSAGDCDNLCRVHGEMATCRSRVDWLMNSNGKTMTQAIDIVNKQCAGQGACRASDFSFQGLPARFDSREKWPACSEEIGRTTDQGLCGSCWAFAGTLVADSRLCISTGGKFRGPRAMMSRGYATSCARRNGCTGGLASDVFRLLAQRGLPSGGPRGCSPYFASGPGTEHFQRQMQAPQCPWGCRWGYGRSMVNDRIRLPGVRHYAEYRANSWVRQHVKQSIFKDGPVTFGIYASNYFLGYSSGIYRPGCYTRPNHETVAIGWGVTNGLHWFLAQNSWGSNWGIGGRYMVEECGPTDFTIPGTMITSASSLPLSPP